MASFDIVSELNMQEADNAINQANKEIKNRYDLKNSKSEIEWNKKEITLVADDEVKLRAVKDILQTKMHNRGIDIRALKFDDPIDAGHMMKRQKVSLLQGIEREKAKEICKFIRDTKLKVQVQIQDDKIQVSSKSRDALQDTMGQIKSKSFDLPLQFINMRQ